MLFLTVSNFSSELNNQLLLVSVVFIWQVLELLILEMTFISLHQANEVKNSFSNTTFILFDFQNYACNIVHEVTRRVDNHIAQRNIDHPMHMFAQYLHL